MIESIFSAVIAGLLVLVIWEYLVHPPAGPGSTPTGPKANVGGPSGGHMRRTEVCCSGRGTGAAGVSIPPIPHERGNCPANARILVEFF